MDVVYYVGGPDTDDRSELRHSLRSLERNYSGPVRDVWVIGDPPEWFTGTKMPLPPQREKFANARQSITAYVNHAGADETFLLMMDDIYITEPINMVPICHLGPATRYSAYKGGSGTYGRAVRQTTDHIKASGVDPLAYLGHTPLPLETARVRQFLNGYRGILEPFLMYAIAGTDGPGRRTGNAKCKADDNFAHKLALDIPFLSSNPDSWNGRLGDWIRKQFPNPSQWETPNG